MSKIFVFGCAAVVTIFVLIPIGAGMIAHTWHPPSWISWGIPIGVAALIFKAAWKGGK